MSREGKQNEKILHTCIVLPLFVFFLFFSSRIDHIFPELPFSRVNKKKEKKDSHDIEGGEKEKEVLQMQINKKRNVYSDRSEI